MMLLRPLLEHGENPDEWLPVSVAAGVDRSMGADIRCVYQVSGDLSSVRWPTPVEVRRADGLWKHTCFEAFVGTAGDARYLEFNWSPSLAYAAYQFRGYRQQGADLLLSPPSVHVEKADGLLRLSASVPAAAWPEGSLQVGLSAVLEDSTGKCHYFALRHPKGQPDFHDRDGFVWAFQTTGV
jgi:hypothetical protein